MLVVWSVISCSPVETQDLCIVVICQVFNTSSLITNGSACGTGDFKKSLEEFQLTTIGNERSHLICLSNYGRVHIDWDPSPSCIIVGVRDNRQQN